VERLEAQALGQLRQQASQEVLRAVEEAAKEIREAFNEGRPGTVPEVSPSPFDFPWTDLALSVCRLLTEDWTRICLGAETPDPIH